MNDMTNSSSKITMLPNVLGQESQISSTKFSESSSFHNQFIMHFLGASNECSECNEVVFGSSDDVRSNNFLQNNPNLNVDNKNLGMGDTLAKAVTVSVFDDLTKTSSAENGALTVDPDSNEITMPNGVKISLPYIGDGNFRVTPNADGGVVVVTEMASITYDKDGNRISTELGAFDPLTGTKGDDIIVNKNGLLVNAGAGDDVIFQLGEAATINGEAGNDEVIFADRAFRDLTIDLGEGDDIIQTESLRVSGELIIRGGGGDDNISVGTLSATKVTIDGGEGNDMININKLMASQVLINGGLGDDSIQIGALISENVVIDGNEGENLVSIS